MVGDQWDAAGAVGEVCADEEGPVGVDAKEGGRACVEALASAQKLLKNQRATRLAE